MKNVKKSVKTFRSVGPSDLPRSALDFRLFCLIFKPCVCLLYELCERLFTMRANKVPFDLIAVLKGQIARLRG